MVYPPKQPATTSVVASMKCRSSSCCAPEDRIWIVDLAALATWRQWHVNEEDEYLRVEFEDFDEEQALYLA